MQRLEPLRKCRICGLEAHSEEDLKQFHKYKSLRFGHENICKTCHSAIQTKDGKYWSTMKKNHKRNNPKRILFKGKAITIKENPRTNICSKCNKKYPEELKTQTIMHHLAYDSNNPLANTIELCNSCHRKLHWKLVRLLK